MSDSNIEVILSSDDDYEELTVEIFYDGKFMALLNQDDGIDNLRLEFPSSNFKDDMVLRNIDLNVFVKALALAKKKISK